MANIEHEAESTAAADGFPRTRAEFDRGRDLGWHTGVQLFVARYSQTLANVAWGQLPDGRPLTTNTILPWFSAGKPLTAVALAILVEQKLLAWDDPVSKIVPKFGQAGKSNLTLRQLLNHTAGFPNLSTRVRSRTWDDTLETICAMPLSPNWIPGKTAGYHPASSWYILGEVAQRIAGQPLADFCDQAIFSPLEMQQTYLVVPPTTYESLAPQLGDIVSTEAGPMRSTLPKTNRETVTQLHPGSGARGPVRFLGRFYQMLLNGGAFRNAHILNKETVDELIHPSRIGLKDQTFGQTIDWGLGFLIDSKKYGVTPLPYGFGDMADEKSFGHGGRQSSIGFADPKHGLVIAYIFTGAPGEPAHLDRNWRFVNTIYQDLGFDR